ncbi:MAG: MFS transporter [Desulfobulbaceae bacterium]|nr:MFS transporter [Desulfobulbaceae bacterium]
MLIMPVVALFYNENGLSELNIFLLQAIYSVSVAIMEIPSGYMADILGRKKTLVLGAILGTAGFAIYSMSTSFSGFLLAEIILGIGGSFISGADTAMLFDSLEAMRLRHRYLQLEGRITSFGNFAETIAAVCGGLIAAYFSYRAVYICQTLVAALAIPASLLLLEPPKGERIKQPGITHILSICKQSLFVNKKLSSAIFQSSVTGTATLCMAWTSQIYFVNQGFDEVIITPLWVTLNLTVAIIAAYAAATQKFLGEKLSLSLIIIFIPAAYVFLGQFHIIPAIITLYLFYGVRGYATPVLKDLTNKHCSSSVRATVFSIRSLIIRLSFALLGPMIGWITIATSLSTALTTAGILLLFFSSISGYFLFKQRISQPIV